MPKIPPKFDRMALLRSLGVEYDRLNKIHSESAPKGGDIPAGGGDWMDSFFRMEGVRGVMTALRAGKTVDYAIQFGKDVSTLAVKIWNGRREYQVRRWEETGHSFIERTVRKYLA